MVSQKKSKQKFCPLIGCRHAVNITNLVLAFHKLIVAQLFKKIASFCTARVSVIHFHNISYCIQSYSSIIQSTPSKTSLKIRFD